MIATPCLLSKARFVPPPNVALFEQFSMTCVSASHFIFLSRPVCMCLSVCLSICLSVYRLVCLTTANCR